MVTRAETMDASTTPKTESGCSDCDEQSQQFKRHSAAMADALREALEDRNLVIVVGAGITQYSTMEENRPLDRFRWDGLVKHGLSHYRNHIEREAGEYKSQRVEEANTFLAQGDMPSAGGILTELLNEVGQWTIWLEYTFANLEKEVRYPAILDSLKRLNQRGAILVTTNYDDLLEHWCGLTPVDASNIANIRMWEASGQRAGVFHPHGHFRSPDTVVFDNDQYEAVVKNDEIQLLLRSFFSTRKVLFVGCGGTLVDANFGPLIDWSTSRMVAGVPTHLHLLLRDGEGNPVPKSSVHVHRFGMSFHNIAPWLNQLLIRRDMWIEKPVKSLAKNDKRRLIDAWLAPQDQSWFSAANTNLHAQTGSEWLLTYYNDLKYWRESKKSLVWIHGSAGFGKTVSISSIIYAIQSICQLRDDSLAYFYCQTFDVEDGDNNRTYTHSFSVCLRTIIAQLCPPGYIFPVLLELYEKCVEKHPPRAPFSVELEECLLAIFELLGNQKVMKDLNREPGEVFLFIDGIDHLPVGTLRDSYLLFINKLAKKQMSNLHILVSSQDQSSIRNALDDCGSWSKIPLGREEMQDDMREYVRRVAQNDDRFRHQGADTQDLIEHRLIDGRKDSFKWLSEKLATIRKLDPLTKRKIAQALPAAQVVKSNGCCCGKSRRIRLSMNMTCSGNMENSASIQWLKTYDDIVKKWVAFAKNGENKAPKVKVALIGLGYDNQSPWIRGALCGGDPCRIKDSRNWLNGEGNDIEGVKSDEEGFGTRCVASLLRMAPLAEIFIAQVINTTRLEGLNEDNLAKSIAQAICHAKDQWQVDVIILPFSLQGHNHGNDLDRALKAAYIQDIAVFCAATEPTRNRNILHKICEITMPFQIYSTNGDLEGSPFNPGPVPENHRNFAILGEDVPPAAQHGTAWPRIPPLCFSGLAVSTILAGGLAAAILDYRQSLKTRGSFEGSPLRGQKLVSDLLDSLSDPEGPYRNLSPYNLDS